LAAIPESTNATFDARTILLLIFLDQAGTRLIRNTSSRRLMYRSAVACGSLDIGELHYVPGDQVGDVGVMEPLPAPWAGPRYRFGEAAAHDPVGVFGPADLGGMPEVGAVREDGVDEPVGRLVDLPLRERPEFDGLHPAGQRVRQGTEPQHPSRSAEQVAAGTSVVVHLNLDRQQQLGYPLYLVDDHHVLVVDESGWIR
jgi:hypothetical protein